jgi:hypothetical protein
VMSSKAVHGHIRPFDAHGRHMCPISSHSHASRCGKWRRLSTGPSGQSTKRPMWEWQGSACLPSLGWSWGSCGCGRSQSAAARLLSSMVPSTVCSRAIGCAMMNACDVCVRRQRLEATLVARQATAESRAEMDRYIGGSAAALESTQAAKSKCEAALACCRQAIQNKVDEITIDGPRARRRAVDAYNEEPRHRRQPRWFYLEFELRRSRALLMSRKQAVVFEEAENRQLWEDVQIAAQTDPPHSLEAWLQAAVQKERLRGALVREQLTLRLMQGRRRARALASDAVGMVEL